MVRRELPQKGLKRYDKFTEYASLVQPKWFYFEVRVWRERIGMCTGGSRLGRDKARHCVGGNIRGANAILPLQDLKNGVFGIVGFQDAESCVGPLCVASWIVIRVGRSSIHSWGQI